MPAECPYSAAVESFDETLLAQGIGAEIYGRLRDQLSRNDPRELEREGKIPGAFHAPRGMLEFWVDPESPYYKDVFAPGKTFVFYCQSGWRSALATRTVQDMGLPNVCHVGGGYRAWKDAGADTEAQPPRGA